MYESSHSLRLNSEYKQQELLREAEARRLARISQSDEEPEIQAHRAPRRLVLRFPWPASTSSQPSR
jgi:predicted RNase H-like nuclease